MGVKKSTVWTSAISGPSRYTPASSLVSKPTSTFGSVGRGKRRKTESSKLGLSFAAQPAALTMAVSFTVWLKPHLAAMRLDYSEVVLFVLAYSKSFDTCMSRARYASLRELTGSVSTNAFIKTNGKIAARGVRRNRKDRFLVPALFLQTSLPVHHDPVRLRSVALARRLGNRHEKAATVRCAIPRGVRTTCRKSEGLRQVVRTPRGIADRKSTRLNSSHLVISYAVFCLKKKKKK